MCGIIGCLRYSNFFPLSSLALNYLHHRGPDDQGIWKDENINLGHTRLSILDLSPLGHQPMMSLGKRFCITFNGEIYNYLELRQELEAKGFSFRGNSDTEVLLAAFEAWGNQCLARLRGMFAFAIWDRHTKSLFLARDRFGEKPLFYYQDDQAFYFASELKALLPLLPHKPELNLETIDLYFHYQYIPEPHTPLKGIYKLPAAHYLTLSQDTWKAQPIGYWKLQDIEPLEGDPAQLIREQLDAAISLTLRSDVPVGLALSGGLDSSAIAVLAARNYRDTLQTFSIGYEGRPEYDERLQAQALAQSLNLPFRDVELSTQGLVDFFPELVTAMDEPIADIAAYGHYSVMKLAQSQGIKVMLSGLGGDELFWGYPWVKHAAYINQFRLSLLQRAPWAVSSLGALQKISQHPFYQRLGYSSKVPNAIKQALQPSLSFSRANLSSPDQFVFYELTPEFTEALGYRDHLYGTPISADNPYRPFHTKLEENLDVPNQTCQALFQTWLVSNCLSLGDRVSMACSVETRLPLLDQKLAEVVIGLRKAHPDNRLPPKTWFKAAIADVLPDEVMNRPKRGFQPPSQAWMAAIINHYLKALQNGYLLSSGTLNREMIERMMHDYQKSGHHVFMLYKAVLLEVWYQRIVINDKVFS
jgi:asparagine synthase (glutamine-hydrolysing)